MAPQDLWYLKNKKGPDGKKVPSKRYGRGRRWRVNYTDPNTGEETSESFDTDVEAKLFEHNVQADISRGQYVDPKLGRQLVSEYAEKWRKNQLHSPGTIERVESMIRLHVVGSPSDPLLGHLALAAVRSSHLKNWVKNRKEVLGAVTVGVIYTTVIAPMFKQAVIDRVGIGVSPCTGVKLPEVEVKDYFIPSVQKIYDLAEVLRPAGYGPIPLMAAGMGWRGAEIFGTELADKPAHNSVDFLRRVAHVRQQVVKIVGEAPYLGAPKSRLSKRTNELPDQLAEVLAEHIRKFPPAEVEMWDRTNPRKPVQRTAKLLFTTSRNLPLYGAKWAAVWPDAVKKVGLPAGFGLHGLRHFFATRLIYGGAAVKTVQLAMGHSKPSITLDRYTSYWPDAVDTTRALMTEALKVGEKPAAEAAEE